MWSEWYQCIRVCPTKINKTLTSYVPENWMTAWVFLTFGWYGNFLVICGREGNLGGSEGSRSRHGRGGNQGSCWNLKSTCSCNSTTSQLHFTVQTLSWIMSNTFSSSSYCQLDLGNEKVRLKIQVFICLNSSTWASDDTYKQIRI